MSDIDHFADPSVMCPSRVYVRFSSKGRTLLRPQVARRLARELLSVARWIEKERKADYRRRRRADDKEDYGV